MSKCDMICKLNQVKNNYNFYAYKKKKSECYKGSTDA